MSREASNLGLTAHQVRNQTDRSNIQSIKWASGPKSGPKMTKEAATARPAGNAGVVISLTIGTGESAELWQIDTRAGVPPDCVVTQIEGQARQVGAMTVDCSNASADLSNAAVRVHIPEPSDLVAMLERRLPPFRALAQRRLVLSGDLSQLRAMAWLFGSGGDSDASRNS